ncbi:MAG TPA: hypothetical protein PJ992_10455, partial [Arachnia sp.]|nr:hypothetical protein [Arachnia sp.]
SGSNIITVSLGSRTFRLRPQVHVANSKPDFVLSSEGLPDVAIFTDGWQFHAAPKHNNIADDAAKRRILRQGGTLVLAVTAQDLALDEAGPAPAPPPWFKPPLVQRLNAEPAMQHTAAAREALLGGPLAFLAGWMQQPDPDNLGRFARAAVVSVLASGQTPGDGPAEQAAFKALAPAADARTAIWSHSSLAVAVSVPAPGSVRLAAVLDDTVDLTTPEAKDAWREWLRLANVAALLPASIAAFEARSAASPPAAPVMDIVHAGVGLSAEWQPIVEELSGEPAEALDLIAALSEAGVAAPDAEVGYELDGVPFDLVWTNERIAVRLDPAPVPPQQGWRIVAPDAALIAAAWKEQLRG